MVFLYYFDKKVIRNYIKLACANLARSRGTTAPIFSINYFLGLKQLCTRFLYNFHRYNLWSTSYTKSSTRSLKLIKIKMTIKIPITLGLTYAQDRDTDLPLRLFSPLIHSVCISLLSFIIEILLTFLGHLKMSLIYFHLFWNLISITCTKPHGAQMRLQKLLL